MFNPLEIIVGVILGLFALFGWYNIHESLKDEKRRNTRERLISKMISNKYHDVN